MYLDSHISKMKNYSFKRMILLILLSGVIISAIYFLAHKGDINRPE